MPELAIVWRNPQNPGRAKRRRIHKFDLGSEVYAIQELVPPGIPEVWITIFAFTVHVCRPWISAAGQAS